jgi:HSP20 family protein
MQDLKLCNIENKKGGTQMNAIIVRRPSRALRVLEPSYLTRSFFADIDELLSRPFEHRFSFVPRTDMYEEKGELVIKTELSDVKKEDLGISLDGDTLTIKAEKKREEVEEDATHYSSERYFGRYFRTLSLPFPVDADKASASFENGLLEIRLPKAAKEVKAKQIEVKAQLPEGKEKKRTRKAKKTSS